MNSRTRLAAVFAGIALAVVLVYELCDRLVQSARNDGIVYRCDCNCPDHFFFSNSVSGVSRKEAEKLDSSLRVLYPQFVMAEEVNSTLTDGVYFISSNRFVVDPGKALKTIIKNSGLEIKCAD